MCRLGLVIEPEVGQSSNSHYIKPDIRSRLMPRWTKHQSYCSEIGYTP